MEEILKKFIAALVAAGLIAGSAAAQTITVAYGADLSSLDPHRTNDVPSAQVMRQIYDTLFVITEELEIEPGLAESYEFVDDTTLVLNLRQGVTWHNGDAFTSADVVWTLDRFLNFPAQAAFLLASIDSVEALDDHTVQINLEFPFAPILRHLSHTATSILNQAAVEAAGDDYGSTVAIGTGPFIFDSWVSADRTTLHRNPNWWGGEVLPETVVFRPIPDGSVRGIELETGGVDIAYSLPPSEARRIEAGSVAFLAPIETTSTTYAGFNVLKPPFHDVRVRQAFNHAIDIDLIVDVVYTGQATRATAPTPPAVWGSAEGLTPYTYDPERAAELLEEAGYGDGFHFSIWTNDNPLRVEIAQIMQAELSALGITTDIQVMEFGAYLDDTAAGLHDLFILGWSTPTVDADYGLYALFHSSQHGAPGNRSFFTDASVDAALDAARVATDTEERMELYAHAQELIWDAAPWIFILNTIDEHGVANNVSGFTPHPASHHRMFQVSKDQ